MSSIPELVSLYRDLSGDLEKAIIDGDDTSAEVYSRQLGGVDQEIHDLGCYNLQQQLADERHYSILVANNSRPHADVTVESAQRSQLLLEIATRRIDDILSWI